MQTYAVYWKDIDGARFAGRISLSAAGADLVGSAFDGRRAYHRIDFAEIASVSYERGRLHVWPSSGQPFRLGSVEAPGALRELGERLQAQVAASAW